MYRLLFSQLFEAFPLNYIVWYLFYSLTYGRLLIHSNDYAWNLWIVYTMWKYCITKICASVAALWYFISRLTLSQFLYIIIITFNSNNFFCKNVRNFHKPFINTSIFFVFFFAWKKKKKQNKDYKNNKKEKEKKNYKMKPIIKD